MHADNRTPERKEISLEATSLSILIFQSKEFFLTHATRSFALMRMPVVRSEDGPAEFCCFCAGAVSRYPASKENQVSLPYQVVLA